MTLPSSGSITSTQVANELGRTTSFTNLELMLLSGGVAPPAGLHSKRGVNPGTTAFVEANTTTIQIPADAPVGALCVLFDMAYGSSSAVTPSGWTGLGGINDTGDDGQAIRINCSRRILTAGQPGATITGQNGSERNRKIMAIVTTALPIVGITDAGWTFRAGGGALTSIAISTGSMVPNCFVFGFAASQNTSPFSRSSIGSNFDFASQNLTGAIRGDILGVTKNGTTTGVTYSMGDGGDSNGLAAGVINLTF